MMNDFGVFSSDEPERNPCEDDPEPAITPVKGLVEQALAALKQDDKRGAKPDDKLRDPPAEVELGAKPKRNPIKLESNLLKDLPEISISEDKFDKLGADVANALKLGKVKRISLINSTDGKLLLLEFSGPQAIDNDPASGCRQISIAEKVTAQLKQTDSELILDNVKGLTAQVDPGKDPYLGIPLPWVTATIKKIVVKQNADGESQVEVHGTAAGVTRSTVIDVPDSMDGRFEETLTRIKEFQKGDKKELAVSDEVRTTAKETDAKADEENALGQILQGLITVAAAYLVAKVARRAFSKPLIDPSGAGEHTFKELPKRLQEKLPTEFNQDVRDALERTLEAKRKNWPPEVAAQFRKLADAYAREEPEAIRKVHEMLSKAPRPAAESTAALPITTADASLKTERLQHTPELQAGETRKQRLAVDTFTSTDGIRFLKAIPITELTAAKVQEKLESVDKEIQRARESGLHEYAEELKRMQREYADKKTPGERESYCQEVMVRIKEAHDSATAAGKARPGIATKAGTTVAVLLVAGWLMDVTAPPTVAQPHGQRVLPGKR